MLKFLGCRCVGYIPSCCVYICCDVLINRWSKKTTGYLRSSFGCGPSILSVICPPIFEKPRMKSTGSWTGKKPERVDFEESSSYMSLSRFVSQSVLGTPKQHKQTAKTCPRATSDTVEAKHERLFSHSSDMTYVASLPLCNFFLRLSVECWLAIQQFPVLVIVMERESKFQQSQENGEFVSETKSIWFTI